MTLSAFIPTRDEAGRSLAGLFYLILGRRDGLRLIDVSSDGFWRSFGAFAWAWPVQIFLWTGMWRSVPETRPDSLGETLGFFVVASGFDLASWVIPAMLLLAVSQLFGLSAKFSRLVVVTNWFSLLSAYIGFFPAALRYLAPLPDGANALMSLAVYGTVIWLYFRVIRISVDDDAMISALITALMVITGLLIADVAFTAFGG